MIDKKRSKKCKVAPCEVKELRGQCDINHLGINVFSLKNKDFGFWEKYAENNRDFYGSGVIRFAARWANMMEVEMIKGRKLSDIAEKTCRRADFEGVTVCMYAFAVSILSKAWKYGEEFRRWHDAKIQIHV